MKLFADYHTHPQGHRLQRYTLELLQPWIDAARQHGLTEIAFTDHERYRDGVDFDVVERLREANPDIQIRAGIELDNDPVHGATHRRWVEQHWDQLDLVLGSVHYLHRADQMFDAVPEGSAQFDACAIDDLYADYFQRVRELAESGLVDCLAHIDLVKIHGHRPDADVRQLAGETFDLIRSRGLCIELSTAGWRKPVNEMYPSDDLLLLAIEKGIPFTTASDAHSHVQVGAGFERLEQKAEQFGISASCVIAHHQAKLCPFESRGSEP